MIACRYGESLLADILGMRLWVSSKAHFSSVETEQSAINYKLHDNASNAGRHATDHTWGKVY